MFHFICCPAVLVLALATTLGQDVDKPAFTVSKETTYLTGPLYPDGNVDYLAGLNAKLSAGVTRENNALVPLIQAVGPLEGNKRRPPALYQLLGMSEPAEQGDYLLDYPEFHKKFNQPDFNYDEWLNYNSKRPWYKPDFPQFVRWMDVNEKPLQLVEAATKRSHYFQPHVSDPNLPDIGLSTGLLTASIPILDKKRTMVDLLLTRAMLRLGAQDTSGAWADILTVMRLSRVLGKGPVLIDHLLMVNFDNLACDAVLVFLQEAELSKKQLQNCLHDLEQLPPMSTLASKYEVGERCYQLDSLLAMRRQKQETSEAKNRISKINWDVPLRKINVDCDRLVAAMNETSRIKRLADLNQMEADAKKRKEQTDSIMKSLNSSKPLDDALMNAYADFVGITTMPAIIKTHSATEQNTQRQLNLRIAFALAQYHLDKGGYPESLTTLAPTYMKVVPNDLFSDKPLIYSKTKKGYRFYSVGLNGKDEGGRSSTDDPRGDDILVQMPLPNVPK